MKILGLALLTLVISGCGRSPGSYSGFEEYVNSFVAEGRARGVSVDTFGLDIKFVDSYGDDSSPVTTIGECNIDTGRITVSKSFWDDSPDYREELLFHELGHCLLYKKHTSVCPNIMCTTAMDSQDYYADRVHFLDVLFSN